MLLWWRYHNIIDLCCRTTYIVKSCTQSQISLHYTTASTSLRWWGRACQLTGNDDLNRTVLSSQRKTVEPVYISLEIFSQRQLQIAVLSLWWVTLIVQALRWFTTRLSSADSLNEWLPSTCVVYVSWTACPENATSVNIWMSIAN